MVDTTIDPFPYERLDQLDTAIARLRYILIALLIVMIAGFAFLGVQITRADSRIDQLAAKVDGLDTALGVRFESVNAKVDSISQRLAVELKTMGAEITAQTKSHSQERRHLAATGATGPRASAIGTCACTIKARTRAAAKEPAVTAGSLLPPAQYLK